MKIHNMVSKKSGIIIPLIFSFVFVSCTKDQSIDEFSREVVEAIKHKDVEKFYLLLPSKDEVAKYGMFAYGINSNSQDYSFWQRPYDAYKKSVDSMETIAKPLIIQDINNIYEKFHKEIDWKNIEITKIDTTSTEKIQMSNLKWRYREEGIETLLKIGIKTKDKRNYIIICRRAFKMDKKWLLSFQPIKLEEVK